MFILIKPFGDLSCPVDENVTSCKRPLPSAKAMCHHGRKIITWSRFVLSCSDLPLWGDKRTPQKMSCYFFFSQKNMELSMEASVFNISGEGCPSSGQNAVKCHLLAIDTSQHSAWCCPPPAHMRCPFCCFHPSTSNISSPPLTPISPSLYHLFISFCLTSVTHLHALTHS